MRETQELPALTANKRRISILLGFSLSLVVGSALFGCHVKRTVKVEVPPSILQAKTATFDELLNVINSYDEIKDLSSNSIRLTLTFGKRESGELQEYRSAPGYILLRRPDSMHLVLQYPVTKTTALDLLSVGDDFRVWIPSKDKFFIGNNSAKELLFEDSSGSLEIPIRASHIFRAILPQSIHVDSPGILVSMEEEDDGNAKYYLLSIYRGENAYRIHPVRRIWIERMGLTIARQRMFLEDGQIAGDIVYSKMTQIDGFFLPLGIHINRPLDGYALNMGFKSWRVNNNLQDNAFMLTPPEGAQSIHLKER